jgi:hypothetical protein
VRGWRGRRLGEKPAVLADRIQFEAPASPRVGAGLRPPVDGERRGAAAPAGFQQFGRLCA